MSGSDDDRSIAGWRTESKFYRSRPGTGWLLTLIAVPLLLALIGWGTSDGSATDAEPALSSPLPSTTVTTSTTVVAPAADRGGQFGAMSIVRTGNGFTLKGELPDDSLKASLPAMIRQALPGAAIVDDLVVKPGVEAPEIAGLGGLFGAALDIRGFAVNLVGDTATLMGSATSEGTRAAAATAATATWPNVKVVNDIQVTGAPATCSTLQADIGGLLKTPINFDPDGITLAPRSQQLVGQIASKVRACPEMKLTVVGYTDSTGTDASNVPLSAARAKSVADELISDGVAAASVTSKGAGSTKPLADNATPAGRAQNRRVEITVG